MITDASKELKSSEKSKPDISSKSVSPEEIEKLLIEIKNKSVQAGSVEAYSEMKEEYSLFT